MSIDYVDKKKRETEKKISDIISDITKAVSKEKDWPICLYEGPDDNIFYSHFFSESKKECHHSIVCARKSNVYKVVNQIKNNKSLKKYRTISFVDHDFDDIILENDVPMYTTPCYAIENFYCSGEAFERFVKSELNIQNCIDPEKLDYLKKHFYNSFLNNIGKIAILNSWAFFQRKKGNNYRKVCFDDVNIKDFLKAKDSWKYLSEKFPEAMMPSNKEKEDLASCYIHEKPFFYYRGKWVFLLYKQQIDSIIENAKELLKSGKIKSKPNIPCATISSLVNYVPLDNQLEVFLKANGLA